MDNSVPELMNSGGTEVDKAQYIIGDTEAFPKTFSGAMTTGSTTSYNELIIRNGSAVVGDSLASLGYNQTSGGNSLKVTGEGSRFAGNGNVLIGYNGSNNSLTVEDGGYFGFGLVSSNIGLSAGYNLGSNGNSVTVKGSGTVLSGTYASIGQEGDSNSLQILDGASVTFSSFVVGWGNSNTAGRGKNNTALISGSGSTLVTTNYGANQIGAFGNNNSLTIEDGGSWTSASDIYVGGGNDGVRGSSNSIVVSGSGSSITTTGRFRVGSHGTGNSLTIQDGAVVVSSTSVATLIASGTLGSSNSMLITGTGTSFTGSVTVGEAGPNNTLTIQDGATVDGAIIRAGGGSRAVNNSILITGPGTQVTLSGELGARSGTSNSITIQNGATVTSGTGTVGYSGTGHSVTVKGEGTSWSTTVLSVGSFSSWQSLKVESGALLESGSTGIGESNANAKNNTVVVTGEGSIWNNSGDLTFGNFGSDNTITIADKALFSLGGNLVMNQNGGTNNLLRLDGGFFAWDGDRRSDLTTLLGQGVFQVWDGDAWVTTDTGGFEALYFLNEGDAYNYTGYHNLGGYTILAAVPEPTTWALTGSAALAAFLLRRRRNGI